MNENKRNHRPRGPNAKDYISEPLENIQGIFESDVAYLSRVCIDKDIRVGYWYNI